MIFVGIMFLIPIIVDLIYLEFNLINYIIPAIISIGLGFIFDKGLDNHKRSMNLKHAMVISAFIWLWACFIGAISVTLITHLDFASSIFENMSALTGTGITMFSDVESLPYSVLFLRSLEQWVGGLGVIILVIGVMSKPGTSSSKLYKSEAREDRLEPSIKTTLQKTFLIYIIYTIIGIVLYIIAGMPLFDAINATFTSIATGGMSIKNANIGYYNNKYIYLVTIFIMIVGATSFTTHYRLIKTRGKSLLQDVQFQLLIVLIIMGCILLALCTGLNSINSLFTVTSAITTTGAAVEPAQVFESWPAFALLIILTYMLIGGSSGSTVGSIKLIRVIHFFKGAYAHVKEIMSPEGTVIPIKVSGKAVPEKVIIESGAYIALFMVFIFVGWAIFILYGYDPYYSIFEIISIQGNNGLDLGIINPQDHFAIKLTSTILMWIGRLEIFPVLVLIKSFCEVLKLR